MTNPQHNLLAAAQWALDNEESANILIKRMGNLLLFNQKKSLLYDGYSSEHQKLLKGVICTQENGKVINVIAPAFSKFWNLGEKDEGWQYKNYLKDDNKIYMQTKWDGSHITSYFNPVTNQVEFATRGTLLGVADTEELATLNFGQLAREIATEKYPILLDENFTKHYVCMLELIHPLNRILTDYGNLKDLILLAAFDMTKECNELSFNALTHLADEYKLHCVGLEAYVPGVVKKKESAFNRTLERLQEDWLGSDREGTVIVFADNDSNPLYRLKVKNSTYLEQLRFIQHCTLKNTKEMLDANGLKTWDAFRTHLYANTKMNEELEMAYQGHFETWNDWQTQLAWFRNDVTKTYEGIKNQFATQKEFALYVIQHHKDISSFLFSLHKGDDWNSERMIASLEKHIPLEETCSLATQMMNA